MTSRSFGSKAALAAFLAGVAYAIPQVLTRAAGRALYWVLVANGWLVFALVGQLAWPSLIYVGALWLVTFPAGMWLLRRRFNEGAPLTGQ